MNTRVSVMMERLSRGRDHAFRPMQTIRYALEGALATLVTVAALSSLLGLPAHGATDIAAAILGFAIVVMVRLRPRPSR